MPPNEGQRGVVYARYLFNTRQQNDAESLDDFVADLNKLSTKCNYEGTSEFIESLVRDRFIVGIRNKQIQSKLVHQYDDVSLTKVVSFVKSSGDGNDGIKTIKQEKVEDDPPSIHDKLQVQVDESGGSNADTKVSEEAKIAILIELMNHKSVLIAPSGHEEEKANLWTKVFHFAQSVGANFKSALHFREVFGTWKSGAIQARQDDVKITGADKLILDLFSRDNLDDYPQLASNVNENNDMDYDEDEDNQEYTFDENDLESSDSNSNSTEEDESDEEVKPIKRGRGRPRKNDPLRNSSIAMSAETKVLVLKRVLLTKDVIASQGNEKEKKDVWRNLFNSLHDKLNVSSPSTLRSAFRIWKQRALKKRENPEEVVTECDRLIYKIFGISMATDDKKMGEEMDEEDTKEEPFDDEDSGKGFVDHQTKIRILQEMVKYRKNLGLNLGNFYEIESSWREVYSKVTSDFGLKHLTMKRLKELIQFWQSQAFHASIKQGGPVTKVQKLMYHIYNIDKNAAVPFANMKNGAPPPLIKKIPGCTHYPSTAKVAILKELIHGKESEERAVVWEKATNTALEHSISNITTQRLKYAVKQWKERAIKLFNEGKSPRSKADKLLFELYDLNTDNAILDNLEDDLDDDDNMHEISQVSPEAKMAVLQLADLYPLAYSRRSSKYSKKLFWLNALDAAKKIDADINLDIGGLKRAFCHWRQQSEKSIDLQISATDEFKVAVINEIFQKQEIFLLGSPSDKMFMWKQLLTLANRHGHQMEQEVQLSTLFSLWKDNLKQQLQHKVQLKSFERMLLEICVGNSSNYDLSKLAKEAILSILPDYQSAKDGSVIWNEIHNKTGHAHNIPDPLTFYKTVRRWQLVVLKKEELCMCLNENEAMLIKFQPPLSYCLDVELLMMSEDTSAYDYQGQIFIPDSVKHRLVNLVSAKHEAVYNGSNPHEFWKEALETLNNDNIIICKEANVLQKAYFAWTFEAWKKRISNGYLSPYEVTMLELAIVKKATQMHQQNFDDDELISNVEVFDIADTVIDSILEELIHFKALLQNDKILFWTIASSLIQGQFCDNDNPLRLAATFLSKRLRSQHKIVHGVPLTNEDRSILSLFGLDLGVQNDDNESEVDESDDFYEADNMWIGLRDHVSEKAIIAILDTLNEHRDLVASQKGGRGNHDRMAVWQKALNVAVENGLKVENHAKLKRVLRDWRERAKRNEIDGLQLAQWERYILSIFDVDNIKEENADEAENPWEASTASNLHASVPESTQLVIAKAMMRHRSLIVEGTDNQAGWRKVYRIAQGNGAFYDSINSMRSSIEIWKNKALEKLSKDPNAIGKLDKLLFSFFNIDVGELDLEAIQESNVKYENPIVRLSVEGKTAILEEMIRNRTNLEGASISHRDRFYAWYNVFHVANAVGGNFHSLAQLTTYVWQQLKVPTLQKIQSQSPINEVDVAVSKIYSDLNVQGLEFQAEASLSVETQHTCNFCQMIFGRFDELCLHKRMAHGQATQTDLMRKCRICGCDVGLEKAALRAHFRTYHPIEAFSCDHCDQMFLSDGDFYQHVKSHVPYVASETIERIWDNFEVETKKEELSAPPVKQQRKRGVYRKRVKIELPSPVSDELPKIGKKEGGLCPHCGEVTDLRLISSLQTSFNEKHSLLF